MRLTSQMVSGNVDLIFCYDFLIYLESMDAMLERAPAWAGRIDEVLRYWIGMEIMKTGAGQTVRAEQWATPLVDKRLRTLYARWTAEFDNSFAFRHKG